MNKIDGGAFDPAQAGRLVQWASVREDGWRHALESAFMALGGEHSPGIDDRPRASGPFVAAPSTPSQQGRGSSSPGAQVATLPDRYVPTVQALGVAPTNTPIADGVPPAGVGLIRRPGTGAASGGEGPASTEVPRPEDTAPQVRLAWSAYARASSESTERTLGVATSSAAVDGTPTAPAESELLPQNIFIERTQHGAVLWIRHPNAGSAQLQSMLSVLIQQTRVAGVPVCGVRINGKPIDIDAAVVPSHPDAAQPLPPPILSRRQAHGD